MQTNRNTAETPRAPHHLILEERRVLTATGVTGIIRCDENGAVLETGQGLLTIGGQELTVSELSVQTGEVRVHGRIDLVQYAGADPHGGGFFRRLVR